MKFLGKTIISFLWTFVLFPQQEYLIVGSVDARFETQEQVKMLCGAVGCQYLNDICVVYDRFKDLHPRKTAKYLSEIVTIEALSQRYAQDVKDQKLAPMYIRWISEKVGYGVFAKENIKACDFIGIYGGILRLKRDVKIDGGAPDNSDYSWIYMTKGLNERNLIVDAEFFGNEMRFVNHAQAPNTVSLNILVDDLFYVCYIANKDIAKDEQITVSYGDNYWAFRKIKPEEFVS